jgi:cysteine desulfurase/selenocysteine lyase
LDERALGRIREDFKILSTGLCYFDSAATSLTPTQVIEVMDDYYYHYRASVGRGVYRLSRTATEAYAVARNRVAGLLGARDSEIVFTKNATEAIGAVVTGLKWRAHDKAVITVLEHHSNYLPWLRAKAVFGFDLEVVGAREDGSIDPSDFEKVVDDKTRIVSFSHASNVLGSIAPLKEICEIAHRHGALALVDAAQSAPSMPISVKDGFDFLAFSGHKMLGPTGTGVLFLRRELMGELDPLSIGGGTIRDVDADSYELADDWERFEAGTPNIAGAIGLGRAVEYLLNIGLGAISAHERGLVERMMEGLTEIKGVRIYGPNDVDRRCGIVSFSTEGFGPHLVASILDSEYDIAVRSGHMCCYPLMKYVLGKPEGLVRASVYVYNTMGEVEYLLSSLKKISMETS